MKKMKKGKAVAVGEATAMSEILPDDIMFNILSRLPEKSLSRFRCVSKPWRHSFGSSHFIKMHLDHGLTEKKCKLVFMENNIMYTSNDYCDPSLTCYDVTSIDYPFQEKEDSSIGANIVGSCNGLLCLIPSPYNIDEERICLWNPFTKEDKMLSIPEDEIFMSELDIRGVDLAYGFGYDCKIEDYKLVRILNFFVVNEPPDCEVKVYSLLSNTWKNIPGTSTFIVSFDFGVERFVEILLPKSLDGIFYHPNSMVVGDLGHSLCIFHQNIDESSFVVWQMKEYGVRESWTKLFSIVLQSLKRPSYQLIQSFKIGQFLLYIELSDPSILLGCKHTLVLYNPENERVRGLKIRGGDWSDAATLYWSDAKTYVESLVSLNTDTCLV